MKHAGPSKETAVPAWRHRHIDNVIFLCALAIWQFFTLLHFYSFFAIHLNGMPITVVRYGTAALLVISEALAFARGQKWDKRTTVSLACILVLAICCFNAAKWALLWALPFLFCARNRSFKQIAQICVVVMALVLAVTILAANFGIVESVTLEGSRARSCLGFRYPLYPSAILFSITLLVIALEGKKLGVNTVCVLSLANILMYSATDSRLSFWLAMASLLLGALLHRADKPAPRTIAIALSGAFVVCAAVSIVLTVAYDPATPWMAKLNANLGERLRLGHDGLMNYGMTAFGQKVALIGNGLSATGKHSTKPYNFIDCLYMQGVVVYGLAFLALYVAGMSQACYKALRAGNWTAWMLLCIVAIHAMIDNQGLYLWTNPLLFLAITQSGMGQPEAFSKHDNTG